MKIKVGFIKTSGWFSLVGVFIPGFTAIGIIGLQSLIALFDIECANSWSLLWRITIAGSVILPCVFLRFIQRTSLEIEALRNWLIFFNIIEYTLLQASFASLFTNSHTLCYVTDGQNGLEFAFTGWFAIPIILLLSVLFQQVQKAKLDHDGLE